MSSGPRLLSWLSAAPRPEDVAIAVELPDDLAGAIHFCDPHVAVAGRQDVPAGQPGGRRYARCGHFEEGLALAVVLGYLVAVRLRHQHLAARHAVNATRPAG